MQPIGKIQSTHGVKGLVILELSLKKYEGIQDWDALMIELLPSSQIPFFIENIDQQSGNQFHVKLEEINSPEEAHEILGKNVFLSPNVDSTQIEVTTEADSFIGYQLYDKEKSIGQIDNILNPKSNPLFILNEGKENELLIPANEELILDVDDIAKIIRLEIPEGLL